MRAEGNLNLRPWLDAGSHVALFVLLLGRLPLSDPTVLHGILGPASFPPWAQALILAHGLLGYIYAYAGLLVLAIVLVLQRRDLSSLNIDTTFPYLFIWATFAFSIGNPGPVGWTAAVLAVFLPLLLLRGAYRVAKMQLGTLWTLLGILVAFSVCLILARRILDSDMIRSAVHWMLIGFPPNVVTEEVVFRGLLWMFLKNLRWADGPIVGLQATVFWLAHAQYLFTDPIGFWVIVPILSLALGVIVWKTRSLTAGTIAHVCMNAGWSLILYAVK